MKIIYLAAVMIFLFPPVVVAQRENNSVCVGLDENPAAPEETILTVCEHTRGMAAIPQPRLDFRLYKNGRAELETNPPYNSSNRKKNHTLVTRKMQVDAATVEEITRLVGQTDFQNARAEYPRVRIWTDSSLKTSIYFRSPDGKKKIVLNNFSAWDKDNKKVYPASLVAVLEKIDELKNEALVKIGQATVEKPWSIEFCELITHPERYFRRQVRVMATFEQTPIGEYLYDEECAETKEKPGVGYKGANAGELNHLNQSLMKIQSPEYGSRAEVTVVGILRDEPRADAFSYRYRFDLIKFEKIEPKIYVYAGYLEKGKLYRAEAKFDRENGLSLTATLKLPMHHAARIEWTNQDKFPALNAKQIVFRVLSKDTKFIGQNRWNTVYSCEIVKVE